MIECTIDTHILADLLKQYSSGKNNLPLIESEFITPKISNALNSCIESDGFNGVIVASSFAFIEIINQFKLVSDNKFELSKVIGILRQPPNWFIVEPYTMQTVYFLTLVPKYNLDGNSVEMADAIHIATAMQRGPNTYIATHDKIMSRINYDNLGIRHLL